MEFLKITSLQNNSIKHVVKLREHRTRDKEQLTILEGYRELTRADEYGLEYYAAFPGCSEATEASSKTVSYLVDKVKKDNIPVVFHIEMSNKDIANEIGRETGAKVLEFNSAHNISKKDLKDKTQFLYMTFSSLMDLTNLDKVVKAYLFKDTEDAEKDFKYKNVLLEALMTKKGAFYTNLPAVIMYINIADDKLFEDSKEFVASSLLNFIMANYTKNKEYEPMTHAINTLIKADTNNPNSEVINKERWTNLLEAMLVEADRMNKKLVYLKLLKFIQFSKFEGLIKDSQAFKTNTVFTRVKFEEKLK